MELGKGRKHGVCRGKPAHENVSHFAPGDDTRRRCGFSVSREAAGQTLLDIQRWPCLAPQPLPSPVPRSVNALL